MIALDLDLNLHLGCLDILVDLACGFLVDAVDDARGTTNAHASCSHGITPLNSTQVDAALNELRTDDIDNLLGHEVGGSGNGHRLLSLVERDFRSRIL